MAEKELIKKYVLIYGDAIPDDYDEDTLNALFVEEGIDLDLRIARNESRASQIIYDWKKEGIKPDIVSVDYENGDGINFIEESLKDQDMLPKQLFIHSNVDRRNLIYRKYRTLYNRLHPIVINIDNVVSLLKPYSHKYDYQERNILRYMNDTWDINLPLSKQEALERNNTIPGMLPVETFLEHWNGSLRDYGKDILELLDTDDINNLYSSATLENEDKLTKISDITDSSLPSTINGYIAYSIEEAKQLSAENKSVILMEDSNVVREYLPVMGKLSAMLFTSYDYAHIKDSAEVNGAYV